MYYRFFSVIDIVVSAVDSILFIVLLLFLLYISGHFSTWPSDPDPIQFSPWPTLRILHECFLLCNWIAFLPRCVECRRVV